MRSAEQRAKILTEEQEAYLRQELFGIQSKYDSIRSELTGMHMLAMGWDQQEHALRRWEISHTAYREFFMDIGMIAGSGTDGAHNYLADKTVNFERATLQEMVWETLAAHARSTMNTGVGGTPSLHIVGQNGVVALNRAQRVALANVANMYSAELFPEIVSRQTGPGLVKSVLDEQYGPIQEIAERAGFFLSGFTDTYVEPSSWKERVKEQ